MDGFRLCAALLVLLRLAVQLLLEGANRRQALRNADHCPPALQGLMDPQAYARSVSYTLAKGRLSCVESAYGAAVLLAVLFGGALPRLWRAFNGLAPGAAWTGALFVVATVALLGLLGLPLEWWSQFRLEERFGFNKSTLGLWVADQAKYLALGVAIGFPVMWALLVLVDRTGALWWVWGFALLFGVRLVMIVLFPTLVLPLFNKLSPLPDGDLRARLLALAGRTGFPASTIEVMDGSKRSGHSNAFFTGFGRFRHVVLFDTLMAQLAPEEVEAVLAHEIGHHKCGHVPKSLALTALLQFAAFAAIAWLSRAAPFNEAFGLPAHCLAPTFLLVGLTGGLVTFWFTPAVNWLSRRNEYEADAFARNAVGSSNPMMVALRKLSRENLSNLTPHPLYSMVYYSHPTLVERERALRGHAGPSSA
jgi:STE24 endopeptidase